MPATDLLLAAGVFTRLLVAVGVGTLPAGPAASIRIRIALALALSLVVLPLASRTARLDAAAAGLFLAGEAVVGLALGTTVAILLATSGWAGGLLGTVAGLEWPDECVPTGGLQTAGTARLTWWIGLAAFLAAGGQIAVVDGLLESVRRLPVGTVGDTAAQDWLAALAIGVPTTAFSMAVSLALPGLAAIAAFQLAAVFCLRAGACSAGPGFVQGLAAILLVAVIWLGLETWTTGGVGVLIDSLADVLKHR